MKRLVALLAAVACIGLPAAASAQRAPDQTITVLNDAHLPAATVAAWERAALVQVNQQLDVWWYEQPHIQFGPGGWPVHIVGGADMYAQGYCGYHNDLGGFIYGVVGTYSLQPGCAPASDTFTHEIDEMVVDPTTDFNILGQLVEVGDPAQMWAYPLRGVVVTDFATPSYFWYGPKPWDQMGQLLDHVSFPARALRVPGIGIVDRLHPYPTVRR